MNLHTPSFLQGLEVGRRLKARRLQRQPVAFLCNGYRVPVFPEWDKQKYPKVYYSHGFMGVGASISCVSDVEYLVNGSDWLIRYNGRIHYVVIGDTWSEPEESEETYTYGVSIVKWANFDILNEDGTVYLAASDPVPVYE